MALKFKVMDVLLLTANGPRLSHWSVLPTWLSSVGLAEMKLRQVSLKTSLSGSVTMFVVPMFKMVIPNTTGSPT